MNTVTLNGVRSTLIKGLLIQSLPPITKPQQRVLTETIDGRDGDRLTLLGYAAYDKTMQIALCGDYDVDQVIQYFADNASGKVIFSNEPDKYYNYQIVKQIDFERLLRFKQAKVTFHVQPFKYSTESDYFVYTVPSGATSYKITNRGNIYARPTYALQGTGTVTFSVAGMASITIDFSQCNGFCVIDTVALNAYNTYPEVYGAQLVNRAITGDYNNLIIKPGQRTLSWSGTLTALSIANCERWL